MRFAACWTHSPRWAARSSRPVLLAASGPAAVFAACSAASLLAGLVVVALPYDAPPRAETAPGGGREVLQGFTTIAADRRLGLITVLGVVQTFTRGCLTVFAVVVAIDLLDTGDPGVGVLNAAVGAGGVLGSILAFGLVRRGGLASWFGLGITLFGAPLALIGVVSGLAAAVVLLGVVGIGNALIDVGERADRRRRLHAAGPAGGRDCPRALRDQPRTATSRIRGRKHARERPAAHHVPDRRDRIPGQLGCRRRGRDGQAQGGR